MVRTFKPRPKANLPRAPAQKRSAIPIPPDATPLPRIPLKCRAPDRRDHAPDCSSSCSGNNPSYAPPVWVLDRPIVPDTAGNDRNARRRVCKRLAYRLPLPYGLPMFHCRSISVRPESVGPIRLEMSAPPDCAPLRWSALPIFGIWRIRPTNRRPQAASRSAAAGQQSPN